MAAGAIPVVFGAGGHKEIIHDGVDGFLWENEVGLRKVTQEIVNNKVSVTEMRAKAKETSLQFGFERFKEDILKILQ